FNKVKNRLINLFSQQKVVFYGAGLAAELFYKSMREQINITAFVDWNINLHFTRFENDTTVYPPDYLKFLDYDVVLITPLNRKDEISFFLRSFLDESKMSKLVYLEDMLKETM
ncbi:hypothetical protein KKB18_07680, partial [bacterium]|nr:hypothetical protein [bacterium]